MRFLKAVVFCLAFVLPVIVQAQATGIYAFGPFDAPGFDTINRGNLNVHFSIPIISKPGRSGTNFNYALNYDGLIWSPKSSSGASVWTPAAEWGWTDVTNPQFGYISYNSLSTTCTISAPKNPVKGILFVFSNYAYHDQNGVSHSFPYSYTGTCNGGISQTGTSTYTLSDNSGLTIYRNGSQFIVFDKNGAQSNVPLCGACSSYQNQVNPSPATYTDTNGNQISVSASGVFTDTMGKTVLTVTGAAPNPVVYAYTDPNGNDQTVTVNYSLYTVATAFGMSDITEYNQPNIPLVSSIVYSGDGSAYSFTYEPTPGNPSAVTGRIASITLRTGGRISYTYTGSNNGIEPDGTTAGLTRTTSDGATAYIRSGISSSASNTSINDALGNVTTSAFLINSNSYFYETDHATYSGVASGTPLKEIKTCYNDQTNDGCAQNSVASAFSYISASTYQNGILTNDDSQWYTGPELLQQEATFAGTVVYAYNTYTGPYGLPFYRLASLAGSAASPLSIKATYGYDEGSLTGTSGLPQHLGVTTSRGNLTSVHQWINSSGSTLDTTFTYDDAGTVLTKTDPNGVTTYGHDSTDTFVTSTTLPTPSSGVALSSAASYDPNMGVLTSATDPNGTQTVYTSFDGFGRPQEIDNLDSSRNMVGKTTVTYRNPNQTGVFAFQNNNTTTETETLLDGYGRQIRVATSSSLGANPWYQQDICYDADGNVSFQSYRYQGSGWATAQVCSGAGDAYTNDALARVTKVVHADQTTVNYSYYGNATQVTDENGVSKILQMTNGSLGVVCELSSNGNMPGSGSPTPCSTDIAGTGFRTVYSYAAGSNSNLVTITQGSQNRSFQTDWLGRTILTQEPERGQTTYSYAYNGTGLVVTRKRPKANQTNASVLTTTTTQYDALGRVLSVSYDDGTPTSNYSYDQSTIWGWTGETTGASKGRLTEAIRSTTNNYTAEAYVYDAMGRVTGNLQCLPSACGISPDKWTYYSYDWQGNILTSTDGAGVITTYGYTSSNEVNSISSSANDAVHPPSLVSNIQYGANGPLSYQFGNGLEESFSYDGLGRLSGGWLCNGSSQNYCPGGSQVYGYVVTWNGSRAISQCDTVLGVCTGYGYDDFNRLTSRNVGQGPVQNFTYVYDRYGNRWQQNVTAGTGPQPNFLFNTSNNHILNSGYIYDAAGNLLSDGTHSYSYDADGNQIAVDGGTTAKYTFNALNQRVRIDEGSSAKEFVFNLNGGRASIWDGNTGVELQGQYYWGTMPIAFYAGWTFFQHPDWLGTIRMETTYDGSVTGSYVSLPFGDGFSASGSDNDTRHFALLDDDYYGNFNSGNAHAQYREFSEGQGYWLSPDPYSGSYDFSNPQSLNRYAYVNNNPLTYVDPLGLALVLVPCGTDGHGGTIYCGVVNSGGGGSDGGLPANPVSPPIIASTGGGGSASPPNSVTAPAASPSVCTGAAVAAGASAGALIGEGVGALVGGGVGTLVAPGVGTVGVGAVGGTGGATIGATIGSVLGGIVGNVLCSKGGTQNVLPSWAQGQRPLPGEKASDFAKRLCDQRYGPGNYPTGPGSEYNKILKWARYKFGI